MLFTEKYTNTHTHSSKLKKVFSAVVISISGANLRLLQILWMLTVGSERGCI
jgi:hypothetical protein